MSTVWASKYSNIICWSVLLTPLVNEESSSVSHSFSLLLIEQTYVASEAGLHETKNLPKFGVKKLPTV